MNCRLRQSIVVLIGLSLLLSSLGVQATPATAAPRAVTWPQLSLHTPISGFSEPVYITSAHDGSGRLFVVERAGRIRIVKNGVITDTFLDISNSGRVQSDYEEQGLLSVAFPPDYAIMPNKHFYVYYTHRAQGSIANRTLTVARYFLTSADQADPNSEQLVLTVPHPNNDNHDGGQLQFGITVNDRYLYIGTGDGGSGGDPPNNAQTGSVLLGKLLRIDPETGNPITYTVPASNPFVGNANFKPEIWAYGLRNPWRYSFDRANGDLYIGDVGQNAYEEVDYQPQASTGGENYSWHIMEGFHCYPSGDLSCNMSGLTPPVAEYEHSSANGCSITGGYVYRGPTYPRMAGVYFYADFCSGRLWGLQKDGSTWVTQPLLETHAAVSSFGEDEAGELYLAALGGTIYQVTDSQRGLPPGWNLISLPYVSNGSVTTSLSGVPWTRAVTYSAGSGWQQNTPTAPPYTNRFTTLDSRQAAWIYVSSTSSINISGTVAASTDYVLHPGWNLMGLARSNAIALSVAFNTLPAGIVDEVAYYENGIWTDVHNGQDTLLKPGLGYWVHVTGSSDVTWTLAGS